MCEPHLVSVRVFSPRVRSALESTVVGHINSTPRAVRMRLLGLACVCGGVRSLWLGVCAGPPIRELSGCCELSRSGFLTVHAFASVMGEKRVRSADGVITRATERSDGSDAGS